MTISETTTVGEIASAIPASVRVFQRHGIDFCCGGKMPLGVACDEQALRVADIVAAIEAAAAAADPGDRDWNQERLESVIDHIITTYHDALREELPRIEAMAARVRHVHGAHAAHLGRLESVVRELSADLRSHMQKEESVLFPAIRTISAGRAAGLPLSAPIAVMEDEHDRAGALLAELRTITDGYAAPEWACGTFRALYQGLSELESAMHAHVHLENNVLFPRALASHAAA